MLTITNAVTPEKLKERFKSPPSTQLTNGLNNNLKQNQVLRTHEQLTRPKQILYKNQVPQISKALLHG